MIKKILIFIMILTLLTVSAAASTIYFDIQEHWARDDIYWVTNEVNLYRGYGDYTFKPEKEITRSEFITVLYRSAVNQNIFTDDFSGVLEYSDMDINNWSYSYILSYENNLNTIENVSISSIFTGENFQPDKPITREEAARLIALLSTEPLKDDDYNFSDLDLNYRYYDEIKKLYNNDIIIGYSDRTFRPAQNITRAESVKLAKNIYKDMFYRQDIFLDKVNYIKTYETFFPLFRNYDYSTTVASDDSYIKAVSSLEYLNFGGHIYPGDEHLYDKEPVNTLTKLHNNEYDNLIGTKYYILRYGKLEKNSRIKFTETLLQLLYKNEELSHRNKMLILKSTFEYNKDPLLYSIVVDSLIETADKIVEKFDLYFLKLDYLRDKGKLNILEENEHLKLKAIVDHLMNKNIDLTEEEILEINNLKKEEKFNIIIYYKLNNSLIDYHMDNYEEGYKELFQSYQKLKDFEEYENLLLEKERNIIGVLKKIKSMY